MTRKRTITGCFAFLGMFILILDGKTALAGAQTGIDLCIRTVIPSLFPFFLLSALLTDALSGSSGSFLSPIGKLLGIPKGAESILLPAFLGGYPAGAQAISSAYRSSRMTKENAERMLAFCNNAGPSFLFGMVAPMFEDRRTAFLLWGIHIASAVLVSFLIPQSGPELFGSYVRREGTFSTAMHSSVTIMAAVCGWVILFRVLLAFLDRWFLWFFPVSLQVSICGILELSNGCCALAGIRDPDLRFLLCSGMLGWGGVCVALQTHSAAEGLSIAAYLKGKVLQTIFSLLLSASVILGIWIPVAGLFFILLWTIQKTQKRGRNPASVGV